MRGFMRLLTPPAHEHEAAQHHRQDGQERSQQIDLRISSPVSVSRTCSVFFGGMPSSASRSTSQLSALDEQQAVGLVGLEELIGGEVGVAEDDQPHRRLPGAVSALSATARPAPDLPRRGGRG